MSSSFLVAGNTFKRMYMKNDVIVTTCKEVEVKVEDFDYKTGVVPVVSKGVKSCSSSKMSPKGKCADWQIEAKRQLGLWRQSLQET